MWDGNSIFNLPRKNQDNQGHIAPCSLSCAQDSRAPSPQHLALSSFVSLHFVGLRTDPALWCFREIFRRGVMHARCTFFWVCMCAHGLVHIHMCTVHGWRSENSFQESFLSYHVCPRIHLRWPVLLLDLYPPSRLVGPCPFFFCYLCFGCHSRR